MPPNNPQPARRVELSLGAEEGAASLSGASGPTRATNLLDHPALRGILQPNSLDSTGLKVKVLIDSRVEELSTRTPDFLIPGVSMLNRLGDGEKSVIHLPGFREKKTLQWSELEPFRMRDGAELAEVARRVEARLGVPCDAPRALAVLVERMKTLLRESMIAALEDSRAWELKRQIDARESAFGRRLLQFIPAVQAKDRALRAEQAEADERKVQHSQLHEGNYVACPMRSSVSLMRQRVDSLWHYRPAATPGTSVKTKTERPEQVKSQRINIHSIALASVGIFEKGLGGWDQDYPSSPLQFWIDHIEPHLTTGGAPKAPGGTRSSAK